MEGHNHDRRAEQCPKALSLESEIQLGLDRLGARDAAHVAVKQRSAHAEDEGQTKDRTQDGITDEHGFGYTGQDRREGEGSGLGY